MRFVATCTLLGFLMSPKSASAQKLLADAGKDLAAQIAASAGKEQKRRIAVLPFPELDGRITLFSRYIAEELTTQLFVIGTMDIVERSLLDKVMAEIKLDASGVIDSQTAKQLGKLAGVEAIVSGTITELDSYFAVNSRMIDAQTGRVFSAAQTRIVKDSDLRAIRDRSASAAPLSPASSPNIPAASTARPPDNRASASGPVEINDEGVVSYQNPSCRRRGSRAECSMLIVNQSKQPVTYTLFPDNGNQQMKLQDATGGEFPVLEVSLGNRSARKYSRVESTLDPQLPVRAAMVFEVGPNDLATTLAMVVFRTISGNGFIQGRVLIRDVPVQ